MPGINLIDIYFCIKEISDKREAFETEMNIKRQQRKLEQENHESQKNEKDVLLKKEWKREEEEYNYNLLLTRKKEMDSYRVCNPTYEKNQESKS